jgi:spermidine synthase
MSGSSEKDAADGGETWITETLHDDLRIGFKAERVLFESDSEHQKLVLFENSSFGRMLSLDSVTQVTERDEFIYHEMLTHLPILAHGAAKEILIIGGGDGGMLEETLKHESVSRVTQVEIDEAVVNFSKTYLKSICRQAFEDPRLSLVIDDGARFVATTEARFDIIIIDSTDPIGPGEALFTESFYGNCHRCLNPGGVLVTQNGVPFLQGEELRDSVAAFRKHFADATCYLATVPTYVGGPMAFGWASDDPALRRPALELLQERFSKANLNTRYYTPEVHLGAFALPPYIQDIMKS